MNKRITMINKRLCEGLIAMLGWCFTSSAFALSFTELTRLDSLSGSSIADISGDGSVIIGTKKNAEAYSYTRSTGDMVGLGFLHEHFQNSFSSAVSADGSVIVGGSESNKRELEAFRYTSSGGIVGLGGFTRDPGAATGVSADGSVIVGWSGADLNFVGEAFRYTNSEGMVGLGSLSNEFPESGATAVSADGRVIVGHSSTDAGEGFRNTEAFRHTSTEGMVGLGDLPGGFFFSRATAVSADGDVIVGFSASGSGSEAFRYTNLEGMIGLGSLPGENIVSFASDVSADGSVIVGSSGSKAFIWDAESNTMQDLYDKLIADGVDLSEWSGLSGAIAISDDGSTIVGSGIHNGNRENFITQMSVVPIPASVWLMGMAILGLLGFQRKVKATNLSISRKLPNS